MPDGQSGSSLFERAIAPSTHAKHHPAGVDGPTPAFPEESSAGRILRLPFARLRASPVLPFGERATYTPREAPPERYLQMLDAIGFTRGVLVQPSAHGLDNRALLNALSVDPARVRGVAVVDQGASVESLAALKSRGVRGLRFSRLLDAHGASRYKNTVDVSAIDELLPKMLEVGLHAQLWLGVDELAELSPLIRSASIPFVIDHLGRCDARRGVGDTAFQLMCDLVREGHLWVKLTPYRASTEFPHYQDMRPFHEHLVATRPDRLLWGSDWPHVNIQRHVPDAGHLVDLLDSWTPDRSTWRQILVSNPSQLYDF